MPIPSQTYRYLPLALILHPVIKAEEKGPFHRIFLQSIAQFPPWYKTFPVSVKAAPGHQEHQGMNVVDSSHGAFHGSGAHVDASGCGHKGRLPFTDPRLQVSLGARADGNIPLTVSNLPCLLRLTKRARFPG